MKFLPFFPISFVLALVFNGLDAVKEDLAHQLREAKKEVAEQSEKVGNLKRLFDDTKSSDKEQFGRLVKANFLRRHLYHEGKSHAVEAFSAQQLLRDVKVEMELQTYRVVTIEKTLNEVKSASKSQPEEAAHAEKLLHGAKNRGMSMAKKIEMAEELLSKGDIDSKTGVTEKFVMAEKALNHLFEESKLKDKQVAAAEKRLQDVQETDQIREKLNIVKGLLDANVEGEQLQAVRQLLHDVKHEIKLQGKNIEEAEKLLRYATQYAESYHSRAYQAEDLMWDAKKEDEAHAKEVANAVKLLHEVKNEAEVHGEEITEAEELLKIDPDWFHGP